MVEVPLQRFNYLRFFPIISYAQMNNFITIAVFQYPAEYSVLRLLFDQEEIRYFFQNETMISVFPFYSNAIGGIRLQVHEDDVERAQEIIDDLHRPTNLKIV